MNSNRKYNFYSEETGEKIFVSEYTLSYTGSGKTYKDKYGKKILDSLGNPMKFLEREIDWSDGNFPAHILGRSKGDTEKRVEQLKKRSKEHYKKEISEVRYEKNKGFVNKFKNS